MIRLENTEVVGWQAAIRGMRNPMNSWDKSDSGYCKSGEGSIGCENCYAKGKTCDCHHEYDETYQIGKNDHDLMMRLVAGGPVHAKFRRMIVVYVDILAPLYWWKEFDTYKVGTVANSCSTMHKIHDKEFTLEDFSYGNLMCEGASTRNDIFGHTIEDEKIRELDWDWYGALEATIIALNGARERYLMHKDKKYWWQMIQLLPSSYNQRRTVMLNYEVLANIYRSRREHKLDEWRYFCLWIEELPYSEIIIRA